MRDRSNAGCATTGHGGTGGPPPVNRLLVIDDNDQILCMIAIAARRLGYDVVTATGFERWPGLDSLVPSLVLLDLHLGATASASATPGQTALRTVPTVLMSGDDETILRAAEADHRARGWTMAGALAKPFSLAALREILLQFRTDPPLGSAP
jgi:CheY-like chemotaxis protein